LGGDLDLVVRHHFGKARHQAGVTALLLRASRAESAVITAWSSLSPTLGRNYVIPHASTSCRSQSGRNDLHCGNATDDSNVLTWTRRRMMFIAMNRFRVKRGSEEAFEQVWLSRDTQLTKVPGFVEFHLLKGPEQGDVRGQRIAASALRR
jgi:hypothetical protein